MNPNSQRAILALAAQQPEAWHKVRWNQKFLRSLRALKRKGLIEVFRDEFKFRPYASALWDEFTLVDWPARNAVLHHILTRNN